MSEPSDSWENSISTTPDDTSKRAPFRPEKSGITYNTNDGEITAHPSRMVELFDEASEGGRCSDELPPLLLPGHRDLDDDCGDEEIPRFCADCGSVTHVGRTCYRSGCPRCWKGWDRRRATAITSKLEALRRYREASGGPGWRGWKFHHLAISPPDGFAVDSDEPLQRTFDLLKSVLGEMNAETGVLFYHPYRGDNGDDRGFWKSVLPDGTEQEMSETREQLSHEPHFHAVVLSKNIPVMVSEAVEEQSGWVINRITKGEDSDVSIYDKYDLCRVVTYCLSHTGIEPGGEGNDRAAYRYFGELANFGAEPHIEREMDAAVRSVATNTLGLRYDGLACSDEIAEPVGDPKEKVELGAAHGDGSKEPETVDIEVSDCGGRMLGIKSAPAFLDDGDWMARADSSDELREAWRAWRNRIDEAPEPGPWDDPG